MNIIETARQGADRKARQGIPPISTPGDTVIVNVRVREGERTRVQAYEGRSASRAMGGGLNQSFTVRKISYGEGGRARLPAVFAADRIDQAGASRQGPPREAVLPCATVAGKSARIAERVDRNRVSRKDRIAAEKAAAAAAAGQHARGRIRRIPPAAISGAASSEAAPFFVLCLISASLRAFLRMRAMLSPLIGVRTERLQG